MGKKHSEVECAFAIGERVRHDAVFEGVVVSCFVKRDRTSLMYVVEPDRGWLDIFRGTDLVHVIRLASSEDA